MYLSLSFTPLDQPSLTSPTGKRKGATPIFDLPLDLCTNLPISERPLTFSRYPQFLKSCVLVGVTFSHRYLFLVYNPKNSKPSSLRLSFLYQSIHLFYFCGSLYYFLFPLLFVLLVYKVVSCLLFPPIKSVLHPVFCPMFPIHLVSLSGKPF